MTLFGDGRVVKAKKTRPVASEGRRQTSGEERPVFEESFNILFPPAYLDRVSCIISLCGKTRAGKLEIFGSFITFCLMMTNSISGSKIVFGRTCLGSERCSKNQDGIQHWREMIEKAEKQMTSSHGEHLTSVEKTHHLTL